MVNQAFLELQAEVLLQTELKLVFKEAERVFTSCTVAIRVSYKSKSGYFHKQPLFSYVFNSQFFRPM